MAFNFSVAGKPRGGIRASGPARPRSWLDRVVAGLQSWFARNGTGIALQLRRDAELARPAGARPMNQQQQRLDRCRVTNSGRFTQQRLDPADGRSVTRLQWKRPCDRTSRHPNRSRKRRNRRRRHLGCQIVRPGSPASRSRTAPNRYGREGRWMKLPCKTLPSRSHPTLNLGVDISPRRASIIA